MRTQFNKKTVSIRQLASFWMIPIARNKGVVVLILATMSVWSLFESFFPLFISETVTAMSSSHARISNTVLLLGVYYCGMLATLELAMRLNEYMQILFLPAASAMIRQNLMRALREHSIGFYRDSFSGSLVSKIELVVKSFENFFRSSINGFYPVLVMFITSSVLLFFTLPLFSIIFTVWFALLIFQTYFFYKDMIEKSENYGHSNSILLGRILDNLRNFLLIRLYSGEIFEEKNIETIQQQQVDDNKAMMICVFRLHILQGLTTVVAMVVVFLILAHQWRLGRIDAGQVAFVLLTGLAMSKTIFWTSERLIQSIREIGISKQALGDIFCDSIDNNKKKNLAVLPDLKEFKNSLSLRGVSYYYPEVKKGIHNFSLDIKKGTKLGIIGASGSGKSTLTRLIMGLDSACEGNILMDGVDYADLAQTQIAQRISVVFQEPLLFCDTIENNIAYGTDEIDYNRLYEAARIALISDFISELPMQYQTFIGESGEKLSVGQKQRISIARAIYKRADILILDEASSALDPVTEYQLFQNLIEAYSDLTIISIAHRMSTMLFMDQVIYLEHGVIKYMGTHQSLLQNRPEYQKFWRTHQVLKVSNSETVD